MGHCFTKPKTKDDSPNESRIQKESKVQPETSAENNPILSRATNPSDKKVCEDAKSNTDGNIHGNINEVKNQLTIKDVNICGLKKVFTTTFVDVDSEIFEILDQQPVINGEGSVISGLDSNNPAKMPIKSTAVIAHRKEKIENDSSGNVAPLSANQLLVTIPVMKRKGNQNKNIGKKEVTSEQHMKTVENLKNNDCVQPTGKRKTRIPSPSSSECKTLMKKITAIARDQQKNDK